MLDIYQYNKDEIKNNLSLENVALLLSHFGADPILKGESLLSKTICHNHFQEGAHKLYYYDNTKLFKCYTECGDSFDIFELIVRTKNIQEEVELQLPQAIKFIADFFGISPDENTENQSELIEDWKHFHNYDKITSIDLEKKTVELKTYNKDILKYFPQPRIIPWEQEGIKNEVMREHNIAYNPITGGILIPHFDINNNLIGIRERTLVKENETRGKYLPSIIYGTQYSHPLSFNLYGLEKAQENIKQFRKAIIVEAEKSVLLYESYYGIENSLAVATCGSNLINYQFQLLQNLGVQEIIIGFDKDFEVSQDENFNRLIKKLKNIHQKYSGYVQISFLFDKWDLLSYKASPLDCGKDAFEHLLNNRIYL